jgi:hypothetical protein
MLNSLTVIVAAWMAVAALTRPMFVPSAMSGGTFVWVNVLGGSILAVILLIARSARPVRSIAHVLYDAEHPAERG